jgi:hypothetical protein
VEANTSKAVVNINKAVVSLTHYQVVSSLFPANIPNRGGSIPSSKGN